MSLSLKYRAELDGLRTIAVAGVILFHYNPNMLRGGYLGVDVFFVISGYLLTAIITRELQAGEFSFKRFWLRRLRRLYPALVTMVVVVCLLGNFIQFGAAQASLPMQGLASIFSFSNILFWRTTGNYWGQGTGTIPLLHTWSLSLEEHFYIVIPIFLFLIHRYRRQWLLSSLWLVAVTSFALNVYGNANHQVGGATFFLLPTRAWELLIGSLLAVTLPNGWKEGRNTIWQGLLCGLGIALIIFSFITIGGHGTYPVIYQLSACLGTAAIIAFGSNAGIVNAMLAWAPMRWIGLISYSLYLWHWPLMVFALYRSPKPSAWLLFGVLFAISACSYLFIEAPCRRSTKRTSYFLAISAVPLACALAILWLRPHQHVMPSYMSHPDMIMSFKERLGYDARKTILDGNHGIYIYSQTQKPKAILLGSSHARMLSKAFSIYATQNELPALLMGTAGVPTLSLDESHAEHTGDLKLNHNYNRFTTARLMAIRDLQPDVVILVERWDNESDANSEFTKPLQEIVSFLAQNSGKVIVMKQVPRASIPIEYSESLQTYLYAHYHNADEVTIACDPRIEEINRTVESAINQLNLPNVEVIDPITVFLSATGGLRVVQADYLLYSDDDHLNSYGADIVFRHLIAPKLAYLTSTPPELAGGH